MSLGNLAPCGWRLLASKRMSRGSSAPCGPRLQASEPMLRRNLLVWTEIANFRADFVEKLGSMENKVENKIEGFKTEVTGKFGSVENKIEGFKTEVTGKFGSVENKIEAFKTEVAKEFGSVRTEIKASTESLKTEIEKAKLWMLVTGMSAVMLMLFSIVGHALKII